MNKRLITLSAIVGLAALSRLLPHPPNVTPIAAMALFAGAHFRNWRIAFLMPIAAMFLSDLVLGFAVYGAVLFNSQPVLYLCMRIVSLLGSRTEIVCGLGAGKDLVGRSHECDNPDWVKRLPVCTRPAFDVEMSSKEIDAEVRRRLKENEPLYHIDAELIAELK